MGSSASKLRTGERGDVTGGLLPVEGDRNSKGWGDRGEFLEMLGRLLEGLKEVRFIPFFLFCMLVDARAQNDKVLPDSHPSVFAIGSVESTHDLGHTLYLSFKSHFPGLHSH